MGELRRGDDQTELTDRSRPKVDRAKDILIRGGENISSVEVEDVLYTHNSVMDCAVVGLAHRILGEEVSAVVQLKPTYKNQGITAQTLIDHCKSKLPAFKVPVFITFRDEPLPRNRWFLRRGPGGLVADMTSFICIVLQPTARSSRLI